MVEWIKEEKNLPQIVREGNLFAKNVVPKEIFGSNRRCGRALGRRCAPPTKKSVNIPKVKFWCVRQESNLRHPA